MSRSLFIFFPIIALLSTNLVPLFTSTIGLPPNLSSKADLFVNYNLLSIGIGNEDDDIHAQKFADPRFLPYLEPKIVTFEEEGHALYGICIDSEYLYMTGCSPLKDIGIHDFLLYKCSLSGDLIWNTSINSGIIWNASIVTIVGVDVCVDSEGSIYVVGELFSPLNGLGGLDFVLCKYSSEGEQLWNKTFGTRATDYAQGICIDESEEGIYVVGHSCTDYDSLSLYRYSFDGVQIWNVTLGEEGSNYYSSAVAVDSNGYLIVSGGRFSDFLTRNGTIIKFSPNGLLVWEKEFECDLTSDLAIDSEDNIYVTGDTGLSSKNFEVSLSKYSSEGEQLWNTTFGEEGKDYQSTGISVDAEGNIFLTGYLGYAYDEELLICKFSLEGSQYWQKIFAGENYRSGSAIAVDSEGNFYVVGPAGGPFGPSGTGNILLFMFQDSDNDGLSNQWEEEHGLDPYNADCDGDGFTDGEELLKGTDPLDRQSNPKRRARIIAIAVGSSISFLLLVSLSLFLVWRTNKNQKRKINDLYSSKNGELEAIIEPLIVLRDSFSKGLIGLKEASKEFKVLKARTTAFDRALHFPPKLDKRAEAKQAKIELTKRVDALDAELEETQKVVDKLSEQVTRFKEGLGTCEQSLSQLSRQLRKSRSDEDQATSELDKQLLHTLLEEASGVLNELRRLNFPSSFLVSLDKGTLHKEFQSLYESYLSFHRKCKELLMNIQSKIDNDY